MGGTLLECAWLKVDSLTANRHVGSLANAIFIAIFRVAGKEGTVIHASVTGELWSKTEKDDCIQPTWCKTAVAEAYYIFPFGFGGIPRMRICPVAEVGSSSAVQQLIM